MKPTTIPKFNSKRNLNLWNFLCKKLISYGVEIGRNKTNPTLVARKIYDYVNRYYTK